MSVERLALDDQDVPGQDHGNRARGCVMRWGLIPILISVASATYAAPPSASSHAGDWAVIAGNTPLLLLHLDPTSSGLGGTVTSPKTFTFSANQAFSGFEGPTIVQRIERAIPVGDAWELTMPLRREDEKPTVLTLRRDAGGKTQLGWKGVPVEEARLSERGRGPGFPRAGQRVEPTTLRLIIRPTPR
jgi:hypothetical protein